MKIAVIPLLVWFLSWGFPIAAESDAAELRLSLKEAQGYVVKFSTETGNAHIDVAMAK